MCWSLNNTLACQWYIIMIKGVLFHQCYVLIDMLCILQCVSRLWTLCLCCAMRCCAVLCGCFTSVVGDCWISVRREMITFRWHSGFWSCAQQNELGHPVPPRSCEDEIKKKWQAWQWQADRQTETNKGILKGEIWCEWSHSPVVWVHWVQLVRKRTRKCDTVQHRTKSLFS